MNYNSERQTRGRRYVNLYRSRKRKKPLQAWLGYIYPVRKPPIFTFTFNTTSRKMFIRDYDISLRLREWAEVSGHSEFDSLCRGDLDKLDKVMAKRKTKKAITLKYMQAILRQRGYDIHDG